MRWCRVSMFGLFIKFISLLKSMSSGWTFGQNHVGFIVNPMNASAITTAVCSLFALPALAQAASIFVTGYSSPHVAWLNSSGASLGAYASTGIAPGNTNLTFDAGGNLYVSINANWTIRKFSPTGADLGVFTTQGVQAPWGLAVNSENILYVANAHSGAPSVTFYDAAGNLTGMLTSPGLVTPIGITFDSLDNLYVADESAGNVRKFSASGTDLGIFASGFNHPTGVAINSAGNVYVANSHANSVEIYDATGAFIASLTSPNFDHPRTLAFDDDGFLYVVNALSDTISRFSPALDDLGIFAPTGVIGSGGIAISSAVPEPSASAMLLGTGALMTAITRRRRRKNRRVVDSFGRDDGNRNF